MVSAGYQGKLHKLCSQRRLSSTRALPSRMASRTPLFEWHRAAGARFIEFGGWEMPLQYSGIVDEHLTVRQAVGLSRVKPFAGVTIDFVPPAPWGSHPRAVPPEIEGWGKSDSGESAIPSARDPSVATGRASFLVTRTGYTGEAGFELFPTAAEGLWVWESLLQSGVDLGIKPIGLGARDTLRLEKGYLLSGQDFDGHQTPLEVNCAWIVKWGRPFIGREALEAQRTRDDYPRLVGVRMEDRGIPRPGHRVLSRGVDIGQVTSGTMSPSLRVGIALASVDRGHASPETSLEIDVRGTPHAARVVPLPFL